MAVDFRGSRSLVARDKNGKYAKCLIIGELIAKRCACCETLKVAVDFHSNKNNTGDGRSVYCIECSKPYRNTDEFRKRAAIQMAKIYRYGWQLCERHHYVAIARDRLGIATDAAGERLRQKLVEQNFTCPYTGQQIAPGNMHLDHILPVSRFPHLRSNFDNVEWVSVIANQAKLAKTKAEFIEFCIVVAERCGGWPRPK